MNKPAITSKLAWIAFYIEAGYLVIKILLIFLSRYLPLSDFTGVDTRELAVDVLLIMAGIQCSMLPFAWSCLRSALQKEISENRAVGNLILPSVLYVIGMIAQRVLNPNIFRFVYSTKVMGVVSTVNYFLNLLDFLPWQTAVLVLICCAASIELYIVKQT